MHPITQQFVTFARGLRDRDWEHDRYVAIDRQALELPNSEWFLYSQIARLANYRTRIADLRWRSIVLRSWRTKRQINRLLCSLGRRNLIQRHGTKRYSLTGRREHVDGARLRQINQHIIHAVTDDDTALYVRMIIAMAWTRLAWSRWTWRTVRDRLRVDTRTAQALYAGLQMYMQTTTPQEHKRAVFWSRAPRWHLYRTPAGKRLYDHFPASQERRERVRSPHVARRRSPARPSTRSADVPPHGDIISTLDLVLEKSLPSTPDAWRGRNVGRNGPPLAARWDHNRDTARQKAPAGTAGPPVGGKRLSSSTRSADADASSSAGTVFERLIAHLPDSIRDSMSRQPATRRIRRELQQQRQQRRQPQPQQPRRGDPLEAQKNFFQNSP